MKKPTTTRCLRVNTKNNPIWPHYQKFGQLAAALDRLPDAAEAQRAGGTRGNGFLNHAFLPVWLYAADRHRTEGEFFRSLSRLCGFYGLPEPPRTELPFPRNIHHHWREAAQAVSTLNANLRCMVMAGDDGAVFLATAERLDLGNALFYLPVRIVWAWLSEPPTQALGELVLGIFAYLCQCAEVPFYGASYSFMDNEYGVLRDWLGDNRVDDDPDDAEIACWREMQEQTLYEMDRAAAHLKPRLFAPAALDKWAANCATFQPQNSRETGLLRVAQQFVQLYRDFPKATIHDHTGNRLLCAEGDEQIRPDEYTHLYWSAFDVFSDDLDGVINSHFQEVSGSDEPCTLLTFDQTPAGSDDLAFERRFYPLLEELRDLLNEADKH